MKCYKIGYRGYTSKDDKLACMKYPNYPKPLLITFTEWADTPEEALRKLKRTIKGIRNYQIEFIKEVLEYQIKF